MLAMLLLQVRLSAMCTPRYLKLETTSTAAPLMKRGWGVLLLRMHPWGEPVLKSSTQLHEDELSPSNDSLFTRVCGMMVLKGELKTGIMLAVVRHVCTVL